MSAVKLRETRSPLALGLSFKLVLAQAILAILYIGALKLTDEVIQITLFEAAMGPQIGGAIVGIQHGLNPPLITLMVNLGETLFAHVVVYCRPSKIRALQRLSADRNPHPQPSVALRNSASRNFLAHRSGAGGQLSPSRIVR